MKKLLLLVALGLPLTALAEESALTPQAPEIRKAKVVGVILKNFVTRSNGTISTRTEKVCDFEGEVPVYDVRGMKEYVYAFGRAASCTSTVGASQVGVVLEGSLALRTIYGGPLKEGDTKTAVLSLSALAKDAPVPFLPSLQSYFGTRNVNETSLLAFLQPDYWSQADHDELFSVEAEVLDLAQ